ncbi:3-phosphoshikimate 1-carboxyvinyltransferase [Mumia sp. zg.B21]|uniref:3-phosphoshikimate 1-carboxyvinyltransferase n=1 Tax=Mumia sp. zg.B21 TaxID=2855447 RepID=UPI001C6F4482|nr:3-phosphoshikimate 1-carboxyvinyltransferase [Mumia sp. zg.B21]MBW9211076.1 3-phosphoshikimate 1-carboxyvinyltransferase [Mumia sp. zg.B21]
MTSPLWAAPFRLDPVDATVSLPGSKSQTNRALVLSALADGPSRLARPLVSRDTSLMAEALRTLGVGVVEDGDAWVVTPATWGTPLGAVHIDVGLAGTVMRFVPPVAALADGEVTFDGDDRARERPMATTVSSLRALGVTVVDRGDGRLPLAVRGDGHVRGGAVTIDASASSQFLSALLLAGARYAEGVDVRHDGPPVPSATHVEMTLTELRRRGVTVEASTDRWTVEPGPIAAYDTTIEPDLSNAGAFVAGALVTAGRVRVTGWPRATDQAGDRWRRIAEAFGADVSFDGDDLVVTAPPALDGVTLDLRDEGELAPVVAAVAALASGPSTLTGIGHLRGHETDRLAALAAEISRLGGEVEEGTDQLTIRPRPLHGATLRTYADHRMAHAAAVLGLAVKDVRVEDVATTAKTYPGFAQDWERFAS